MDTALWDRCIAHAESSRLPDHEGEYLFTVKQEARLLYLLATAPSLVEQVRQQPFRILPPLDGPPIIEKRY